MKLKEYTWIQVNHHKEVPAAIVEMQTKAGVFTPTKLLVMVQM